MNAEPSRPSPSIVASAVALVIILLVTFAAAAVGASASVDAGAFYTGLNRPSWAPPPSVFGPVWSALYLMMAAAAWLTWCRMGNRPAARRLQGLYLAQLVANALWSVFFFGMKNGAAAFADVLILDVLVILTAVGFYRIHRPAGLLMLPYLAWILFATALSFSVWRQNPQALG